jgi:AraC-like DNA-binding protein
MLAEVSADASAYEAQTSPLVLEIQKIIHTKPFQKNIAEVLSEQLNMSTRSLRYFFKKEMGMSLYQYQLKTKLEMAFQQLQIDNQQTMLGIALNFGFYDEFHFSRQFKKHFGIPPSQVTKLFNTESIASTNDCEK